MIYETTVDSREYVTFNFTVFLLTGGSFIALFRSRNYIFSLNDLLCLDATAAGNEARFINHADIKDANCQACRE